MRAMTPAEEHQVSAIRQLTQQAAVSIMSGSLEAMHDTASEAKRWADDIARRYGQRCVKGDDAVAEARISTIRHILDAALQSSGVPS